MKTRRGFTLVELMVVVAIILVLATVTLAVYNTGRLSDRMRSGARVGQSAFLGAKDRAMHAKDFRGVRLTRDANGPTFSSTNTFPALATGFVYLQPLPIQSVGKLATGGGGTVAVSVPAGGTAATLVTIAPSDGLGFSQQDIAGVWPRSSMQVRILSGSSNTPGQWYALFPSPNSANGSYWTSFDASGNVNLFLQTPVSAPIGTATGSIDIQLGSDVMPFHQPIPLPAGTVIDLRYSSSNVLYLAGGTTTNTTGMTAPNIDFTFSPRGNIAGSTGGMGAFYFCIRDLEDATNISTVNAGTPRDPSDPACKGDCLILALNPQTGLVQTYNADLTDANADGLADNLFRFAQQGKAAGR